MSLWTLRGTTYQTRFHRGQVRAWNSEKRFVTVLAGTQSGKTSWGPIWLKREIDRRGRGDYLAVTASYDLFKLKMLPALRETFEQVYGIGRYWSGDRIIELRDPITKRFLARKADDPMWARIILRSAESGAGLESSTAKAAWIDEAGQNSFKIDTWEAILRRLALERGRALLTTTIYNLGWLKRRLYDPWEKAKRNHPEIDVIQFDSTENPAFPLAEYEKARREMPRWKFDMFYRGRFTRPAGLIYDTFDATRHTCPRFAIPDHWERYLGIDFGGANTAAVFYAEEPGANRWYAYREYHAGGRTAAQHAAALLAGEPRLPTACGGAKSEGQWRGEFAAAGLPIREPAVSDVEVGINRVYGFHARCELVVFDDLTEYLDEKATYSRELDSTGEPTEEIEDKNDYHLMDAERYILPWIDQCRGVTEFGLSSEKSVWDSAPEGVWSSDH